MFDAYTSLSMFLITKIILNRDKKEQLSITDTRICVNVFIWIKEREIFLLRHNFYNILNHRKKKTLGLSLKQTIVSFMSVVFINRKMTIKF